MDTIETMSLGDKGYTRSDAAASFSISRLVGWLGRVTERRRQRRDLLELTDRDLLDIGITPEQARREAARPFWD